MGEVVRPDGYGVWTEGDTSLPFLLEHDNGTERLRLAQKLDGYAKLAAEAGHPNWVLFTFPGPRRVLARPDVPVATVARSPHPAPGFSPDTDVWPGVPVHEWAFRAVEGFRETREDDPGLATFGNQT